MSERTFLTFDQAEKTLDGVIKTLQPKRANFYSRGIVDMPPVNKITVNFDVELATKNVMGQFVEPKISTTPLAHQGYSGVEMYLAYTKEKVELETNFETLYRRQIGSPYGVVDEVANQKALLIQDMAKAEECIQNLHELVARDIIHYGGYNAKSEKHGEMIYDFRRNTAASGDAGNLFDTSTAAAPYFGYNDTVDFSCVNLTTSNVTTPFGTTIPFLATSGSFTAGDKAWTKANIDSGKATPWLDVLQMVKTSREWGDVPAGIEMDRATYKLLAYDIHTNYPEASDLTMFVIQSLQADILPRISVYDGLDYVRSIPLGDGRTVPIYVYTGVYHTRSAGTRTAYSIPGCVKMISSSPLKRVYGKIMHPKALWRPMPRWINTWKNDEFGTQEWEIHSSFAISQPVINSQVCWFVR
jgi:hypothetical protein